MRRHLLFLWGKLLCRRNVIYCLAGLVLGLFAIGFALERGDWIRSEEIHGPFQSSAIGAGEPQYELLIGNAIPFLSIESPPPFLRVRVSIDGKELLDAELELAKRWGVAGGLRILKVSLPQETANDQNTSLRVQYRIKFRSKLYEIIKYIASALALIALILAYCSGDVPLVSAASRTSALIRDNVYLIRDNVYKSAIMRELIAQSKLNLRRPIRVLHPISLGIIVIIGLAARLLLLPPVYWDTDSAVLLLWPGMIVPHWQWLSPALSALTTSFGYTPWTVAAISFIQLAVYGLCVLALLRAFHSRWAQLVVLAGLSLQFYVLLLEGGVSTEPFGFAGVLLSLAASVTYAEKVVLERDMDVQCFSRCIILFGISIFLVANSRLPLVPLACVFLATVTLYWLTSGIRSKLFTTHAKVFGSCVIITVSILGQSWLTNQIICVANKSATCESPYGRAGVELIAFDLRKLPLVERAKAVARLESTSPDPLVKLVFSTAADSTISTTWVLQQQAILKDESVRRDPILESRVSDPRELDRAMSKATWIFQTRGGSLLWPHALNRMGEYLGIDALSQIASLNFKDLHNPDASFAREWLRESATAVTSFKITYPVLLPIFGHPAVRQLQYNTLASNSFVKTLDIFSGPLLSIGIFILVSCVLIVASLLVPRVALALPLVGAMLIAPLGYAVLMSVSEEIVNRYRMPNFFFLSVAGVCLVGSLIDLRYKYIKKTDTPTLF